VYPGAGDSMIWQSLPYSLPLLIAAAVCLLVGAFAWRRRSRPGTAAFVLLTAGIAVWTGGYAFEFLSPELNQKLFWGKVQYFGIVLVPVAWLAFALQYSNRVVSWSRRNLILLAVEPAVILALIWNPRTTELIWSSANLVSSGTFPILVFQRGPWFWVHVTFSYALFAISTVVLVGLLLRSQRLYRKQVVALLVAATMPYVGNALFLLGFSPLIDPTPFAFTLAGLTMFWGLLRLGILDIAPVARTAVFEGMKDGVFVLDDEDRLVDLNRAAKAIIGSSASSVVGQMAADVFEKGSGILEHLEAQLEINVEIALSGDGQGQESYDLQVWPLFDRHGARTGRIVVLRDITEQKCAESELRASEERLRIMVQQMPAVLWATDIELNFTMSMGAALDGLGLAPGAVIGMTLYDFFDSDDPSYLPIAAHMRALEGEASAFEFEWSGVHFECHVEPLTGDRGEPIGSIGVALDISERESLQGQLRQSQKMEAVGRMAGGVAHDFNNLLTAVSGYAQLAQEDLGMLGKKPDAMQNLRRDINAIEHAAERATSLTGQLLAFSRKQVLQPRVLDLNTIVTDMEQMAQRLVGEPVSLVTMLDPDLPPIKADPVQIQQVIINLVLNSRDAMPQGGKVTIESANVELSDPTRLRYDTIPPGDYVMLAVSDEGLGMDETVQAHLFEPFFTTKEEGRGTGLGLSTVYGIVKQSSGHIEVRSAVGEGTTFKIYFPAAKEAIEEGEGLKVPSTMRRGTETILLVEDEEIVRVLATRVLSDLGYKILEAADGQEALDVCQHHEGPIGLVITDVVMPGMSGTELAAMLESCIPKTPVLFISGYTGGALVEHGVLDEGMSFLQKPFSRERLAQEVGELLDRS
jgi:two-component system cell cycle sensor histidine kinase/response regulator CckA